MSIATEWLKLAREERKRHRRHWGTLEKHDIPKIKKQSGRPLGTYNPERLELIKTLRRQGLSNADVAKQVGVSESSIRYWRAKYNIL